jgi:hypothetical protein
VSNNLGNRAAVSSPPVSPFARVKRGERELFK